MSLPRYPEYKDSGVAWLGDVPGHWASIRYKNVFVEKSSIVGASLPPGSISFGRVIFKDDEFLHEPTKASYQEVLSGEFLINPINLNYDLKSLRTALSEIDTCVSPAYIVLKTKVVSDKSYLKYQLHVFDLFHMKTLGAGVRQTITFNDIGGCFTVLPPLLEQTQIATFLDRETGKIDALIAEQQRLVELLAEKRQAVISHAVTKGVNPNARMKDSGIAWLGEVPEHWEIVALKRMIETGSSISYGIVQPGAPLEDGVPFIQTTNMSSGRFDISELQRTSAAIASQYPRSRLYGGEVILGIRASIGAAFVVPDELAGVNLSRGVARIKCAEPLLNEFLVRYLMGNAVENYWHLAKQGSTFNEVSIETVKELTVVVPPIEEQAAIAAFLDTETAKFDTLATEANHAIELLQERRSALISATVTGKIDVRKAA